MVNEIEFHEGICIALKNVITATADGMISLGDLLFAVSGIYFISYAQFRDTRRGYGAGAAAAALGGAAGLAAVMILDSGVEKDKIAIALKSASTARDELFGKGIGERASSPGSIVLPRADIARIEPGQRRKSLNCARRDGAAFSLELVNLPHELNSLTDDNIDSIARYVAGQSIRDKKTEDDFGLGVNSLPPIALISTIHCNDRPPELDESAVVQISASPAYMATLLRLIMRERAFVQKQLCGGIAEMPEVFRIAFARAASESIRKQKGEMRLSLVAAGIVTILGAFFMTLFAFEEGAGAAVLPGFFLIIGIGLGIHSLGLRRKYRALQNMISKVQSDKK